GYYLGSVASHDMVVLGNVLRRSLRNSQPGLSGWNEESAAGLQHAAVAGRSGGPEVVVRQQLRTRRHRLHFGTGTKGEPRGRSHHRVRHHYRGNASRPTRRIGNVLWSFSL